MEHPDWMVTEVPVAYCQASCDVRQLGFARTITTNLDRSGVFAGSGEQASADIVKSLDAYTVIVFFTGRGDKEKYMIGRPPTRAFCSGI
jgi:hypothetical protein